MTLEEIRDEALSPVQSMAIAKYVANIEMDALVESNPESFEDLFTGSLVLLTSLYSHLTFSLAISVVSPLVAPLF